MNPKQALPKLWRVHAFTGLEHALLRVGFAWVVWCFVDSARTYSVQPSPNGLAQYLDLTFMSDPALELPLKLGLVLALLAYVANRFLVVSLGYIAAYLICLGTLKNSQGAIGHSSQLITLTACVQWFAHATHPVLQRWRLVAKHSVHDVAVHYAQQGIAAAYMLAGITKLIRSDGRWIHKSVNLASSIVKAKEQQYYNALEGTGTESGMAIAEWILANQELARIMFGSALLLELGACIALFHRRLAILVGLSIVAMHEGIRQLMSLNFKYNIMVLTVYFIQAPCLLAWLYRTRLQNALPPMWQQRIANFVSVD